MGLIDTNVLACTFKRSPPQHPDSRRVVDLAGQGRIRAALLPQVLVERLSIVTSSRRMSAPLSSEQARVTLVALRRLIEVRPVPDDTPVEPDRLLVHHPHTGADVFDLFLAAQMRCYGIADICTYNPAGFALPGIQALTPAQVPQTVRI